MKNHLIIAAVSGIILLTGCHKKTTPAKSPAPVAAMDTPVVKKTAPKVKVAVPRVITVEDKNAKRTFDGRYYYDLMGHRYWRNSKDGKYYLYNKSMHSDPNFQKP